jgi:hypothetical protein
VKLVRLFVALLFAFGATVMVGGATSAWLYIIAVASTQVHFSVGGAIFVGSFFAMRRYPDTLAAPWQMWMGLWAMFDDWLSLK